MTKPAPRRAPSPEGVIIPPPVAGPKGPAHSAEPPSAAATGGGIIPIREPFVDERGQILNLIDVPFTSAAVITSVKGAVRGNHYHKTDYHYCWLQRGEMVYLHRRSGETGPAQRWTIKAGQMFYTPPGYEHAMQFTQDAVLLVFAKNNREMANYEADTVRINPLK